jgi:putative transposase
MVVHNYLVDAHACFRLVESGVCSLREAAAKLGRSYRQTKRLWRRYRESRGSISVFARRRARGGGRNRTPSSVAQAIIDDKRAHPNRSAHHVADAVSESLGKVSRSTVRRVLMAADLLRPEEDRPPRVHTRFEAGAFAERFQIDTTSGAWMPGHRLIYLIAVLDDHSRMLVGWKWVASDDVWNNMAVLRETFEKHGLPRTLYTDNASMFKTIRHGRSVCQRHRGEGYETEIQRAMRDLGVTMFSHKPYEPQGKGKIERFFGLMDISG